MPWDRAWLIRSQGMYPGTRKGDAIRQQKVGCVKTAESRLDASVPPNVAESAKSVTSTNSSKIDDEQRERRTNRRRDKTIPGINQGICA